MAKTGFLPKEKIQAFLDALSKDAVVPSNPTHRTPPFA
jgi:hypothetical protein